MNFLSKLLTVLLTCALLASCGGSGKAKLTEKAVQSGNQQASEYEVYNQAKEHIRSGDYFQARELLNFIVEHYPFGRYGVQAQLNLLYVKFLLGNFEEVVTESDQFLRLNPQHINADYAQFMQAFATYSAERWGVTRLFGLDQPLRDIAPAVQSFDLLREFILKYENSPYAPIARQRMVQLREFIARSEIGIAIFYLKKRAWIAAANRATYVIQNIQNTSYTPYALAIHAHAHRQLGMSNLYTQTTAILKKNFPESKFIDKNGEVVSEFALKNNERTLTNILTIGMFQPPQTAKSNF